MTLADRFPESREALTFYAAIASFQGNRGPLSSLLALAAERGPEPLAVAARSLDQSACDIAIESYLSGLDRASARAFFARVLLQRDQRCDGKPHLPQLGVIRPQGDGAALSLQCAICFEEWPFSRARCPACDETELANYSAQELGHLEVQACEKCGTYLNHVRLDEVVDAVPDVDEIAALPLDVWAKERGYRKLIPNLIGI